MARAPLIFTVAIMIGLLSCGFACAKGRTMNVDGTKLAQLECFTPEDQAGRRYLGLDAKEMFQLSQVKTDLLVVEVFSMYCPVCQREARNVNKLFSRVKADPKLRGKVKLLGLGIANTPLEVGIFKKKYSVPFALVGDPEMKVQTVSKTKFRTPTFIVMKMGAKGDAKIVYTHIGTLGNLDEILGVLSRN